MSIDPTTQKSIPLFQPPDSPGEKDAQDDTSLKESGALSLSSDHSGSGNEYDFIFTEAEDRSVRRKLDLVVMPILFFGFYVFQVSRHRR